MLKIIVYNNDLGELVRIGLYKNNKWVKWIKKKELDNYVDEVDELENKILD